jgi:hypothetical protein
VDFEHAAVAGLEPDTVEILPELFEQRFLRLIRGAPGV